MDTCPYLRVLREWLGKVIKYENCSYLFACPLAFHRGISVRPGVPYAPYRPFASLPSLLFVRPSAAIHRRRCFFIRRRTPFSDNHGGQEPDPSRGCVGSFLSDGEEAGGVGP
jgi:hypothetical protein